MAEGARHVGFAGLTVTVTPDMLHWATSTYPDAEVVAGDPVQLDAVQAERVAQRCSDEERILRLQFRESAFPDEWDTEIRRLRLLEEEHGAGLVIYRWAFLRHCYRVWIEGAA